MNRGTTITVAIAVLSLVGAISMRPRELPPPVFEDTGEPLFADFKDPTLATSLEVQTWDDKAARLSTFKVEQKQGRWVIPSHNDYPADGTERMAKAAASFVDVKRDTYHGDKSEDHGAFGVVDPSDATAKTDQKGRRIIIKDTSGTLLVDVIVGKDVPEKDGYKYVRFPDAKRVYASKLDVDISTEFTDWIEKDLLKIERDDIVTVISDPYRVDEKQGKVVDSNPTRVELVEKSDAEDGGASIQDWKLAEGMVAPAGKALDISKVRQVVGAIDRLQIVGVRPRPKPLTLQALQSKGFFVTPDGRRLFGNEGEVRMVSRDGVAYTLYFGEVTLDSGVTLTAGQAESDKEDGAEHDDAHDGEAKDETKANRYMFVDVNYDPSLDRDKDKPADAEVPRGEARAKSLQQRFDDWFYVISDSSFKQIHKSKGDLFKDAKVDDKKSKAPAGKKDAKTEKSGEKKTGTKTGTP